MSLEESRKKVIADLIQRYGEEAVMEMLKAAGR